jgi:two-component system sensor histidine kinase KdpD
MTMDERPNPDQLLKQVQAQYSTRGKLKIFFGAVAGVGKTYTMLEQARARRREGIDVVVGIVETHSRPETQALLEGLEVLPRKSILYKNIEIGEFDLEAALKRRPRLILVDELAHTNAPGSRHAKRWQDVEELLDAGIDVYATLNVQHCESVNDIVAQITRIIVRETVPDAVVESADAIELVDIPTEELLKRLEEGKVYLGPQAELAAEHFFRLGNLIALRELALRYATRSVGSKLRSYRDLHAVSTVWKVGEDFLVCISASPRAMQIIRAGRQMAADLGAGWAVVHVESSVFPEKAQDRERVAGMLRAAEAMGANVATLTGEDMVATLLAYARSKNIGRILIGKPGRPRLREHLFGSFVDKLSRKCGEIDLYLISGEAGEETPRAQRAPAVQIPWTAILWAVGTVGLCTAIDAMLYPYLALANLIMIYLLGVAWLAYRHGRGISILGTLLSVACFDFFFVPPIYSFTVLNKEYILTFGVMLIVGLIIGGLTGRLRGQTISLDLRERRTQILYSLSRDLAKSSRPDELFQILLSHIHDFFGCPGVVLTADPATRVVSALTAVGDARDYLSTNEQAVASWVYEHRRIAGNGMDTFSGSRGLYIPLVGSRETVAVLGVFPREPKQFLDPDDFHILEVFVKQTALAVEGAELAAEHIKAEAELGRARIRNVILDTATFDTRTALAAISESAAQLLRPEVIADETKRKALVEEIIMQAKQLDTLATELPNILDELKQT